MSDNQSRFGYLGAHGWRPLVGLSLLSAGAGGLFPVVVFSRAALEIDLRFSTRDLTLWFGLMAAAVAVGAVVAGFVTGLASTRLVLMGAGVVGGGAQVGMAFVNDYVALRAGVLLLALVMAPVMALSRAAALDVYGPQGGWRVVAGPWVGFALGACGAGLTQALRFYPNWGFVLGVYGAVMLVGALFCVDLPKASASGPGPGQEWQADRPPVLVTALTMGAATLGVAPVATALLATKWSMDPRAVGAVGLAAFVTAAALAAAGHWYHRLAERDPLHLLGVSGAFAVGVGLLMVLGAASVTFIGLVMCWAGAGAALVMAAVSAETGVLSWLPQSERGESAGLLVAWFALGAAGGLVGSVYVGDNLTRGWLITLFALPGILLGGALWFTTNRAHRAAFPDAAVEQAPAMTPRAAAGSGALLDCEGLDVGYDGVQVLFDVGLRVEDGQVVALMGTNGAGKTTLLRTISGLQPQRRGRVMFSGVDVSSFDPTWRVALGISQIAGGRAVAEALTVSDNLRLFSHSLGSRRRQHEAIDRALSFFPRLAERQGQLASTLSGGEKQMLSLAKALILQPRLLIIDEFSLGLAPKVVGELLPAIARINADGTAVLLVEQSVNIALSVASHAYVMEKGEIVYEGDAATLRDDPDLMKAVYLEGITAALEHEGVLEHDHLHHHGALRHEVAP